MEEDLTKWLIDLLTRYGEVELEDVVIEADELELMVRPLARAVKKAVEAKAITQLLEAEFTPPKMTYPGKILEVKLGATKSEGGSRSKVITIGGQTAPPYYYFESPPPNPIVVSADVFDMPIPLAKAVRMHVEDVMEDPCAWAKKFVDKYKVDMITIHLISTDPSLKDTPAKEAAKTVEEILQAVDVPIIIGGSGAPEKDPEVFAKAAEVAEGERVMLSSATLEVYEPIAKAAKEHGHVVLSWTSLDINQQKELNRKIFEFIPRDRVVMDPTTAALGYGIEYTFTIMERMRLAGLMGDEELQLPMSSGTTNAWAAREAWLKAPELGPREYRGPIWEAVTALTLMLAGCDLFMMMHPAAIMTIKEVAGWLMKADAKALYEEDWTKIPAPKEE